MISLRAYAKPTYTVIIDNGIEVGLEATTNTTLSIDITRYAFGALDPSVQLITESVIVIVTEAEDDIIMEE